MSRPASAVNPPKRAAYNSSYHLQNKEEIAARNAAYRANPEVRAKRAAGFAKWAAANKERRKLYMDEYRIANKDRLLAYGVANKGKRAAWAKIYNAANKDRFLAKQKIYFLTPKGKASRLVASSKTTARQRGLEHNITTDDIMPQILNGHCQATGMKFDFGRPKTGQHTNPLAPSIDRIDSKGGYTIDNIQIVTWAYNRAKCDTDEETARFLFCRQDQRPPANGENWVNGK